MNKQCFRVIFSKTLQRLVVVSELAKSEGKSTEPSASGAILQKISKMRPLVFSLFCAFGFVTFSNNVLAETLIIQADKSAPRNQQPIVLSTANGLPQVNIQTPNDKGLSHNKYSQFDIAEKGAILNNSRTHTQTQQAGMVQGNPYLARGEAKVILNEVNSNKPSVMKGYVEVAGKKADVIIANPSGLHCEGCGIINSDRATFTTGKPEIKNGQVDNFKVEAGKVKVSGKGVDNSRVDYTEIIARETEVNAGIWSKKETKVITGKNTVKRSETDKNLQIIHTNQPLAGEVKPQVAIDVGELGGMYSGKIHLIGTENGVGVRNAGHIGASAETLKIDSQGRIVNTGTLNAAKPVTLTASQGIENKGKIENKQGDIQLKSNADIQNSGSVVARGGNIQQQANSQIQQSGETVAKGDIQYTAKDVETSQEALIAAGALVNDTAEEESRVLESQSASGKSIQIDATENVTLQSRNLASKHIVVKAKTVQASQSRNNSKAITINATQGDIQADNAVFIAETLQFSSPQTLSTQQSYLSAEKITTTQRGLNNQGGRWIQTGLEPFRLSLAERLDNPNGTFSVAGDFILNSQGLNNQQGRILAGKGLQIETGLNAINSYQGQLVSADDLSLHAGHLNNDEGLIQSGQNLTLNTQLHSISNRNTLAEAKGIVAKGRLRIDGKALDNHNGLLFAQNQAELTAYTLNNQAGGIYSRHRGVFHLGKSLNNQQGEIVSRGDLQLNGETLDILNAQGKLLANGLLAIKANSLSNDGALSADDLQLRLTQRLTQRFTLGGDLRAGKHLFIETQGDLINNYQLYANESVSLAGANIENQQGGRISAERTTLTSAGNLINQGLINSSSQRGALSQTVVRATNQLTNAPAGRIYGDHVALEADRIQNLDDTSASAVVAARTRLDLAGREIENSTAHYQSNEQTGSTLFSGGGLFLGRKLNAEYQAEGVASAFRNRSSVVEAEGDIVLNVKQVANENVHFSAEHVVKGQAGNEITKVEEITLHNEGYVIDAMGYDHGAYNRSKYIEKKPDSEKVVIQDENMVELKRLDWVGYSRAGRYQLNLDRIQPTLLKPDTVIDETMLLADFHQMMCEGKECRLTEVGRYAKDSPIWAYANVTNPPDDPPVIPSKVIPDRWFIESTDPNVSDQFIPPEKPVEPSKPEERDYTQQNPQTGKMVLDEGAYQAALSRYQSAMSEYHDLLEEYLFYETEFKPYNDWLNENKTKIEQVENKIEEHNQAWLNKQQRRPTYYDWFWQIFLNKQREDKSKELTSVPGQILAGGQISGNSKHFVNDKSRVIAGGRLLLEQHVENIPEIGLHRFTLSGTSQFSRSRWRGGTKSYFERRWEPLNDYTRVIETPFDMQISKVVEHAVNREKVTSEQNRQALDKSHFISTGNEPRDNAEAVQGQPLKLNEVSQVRYTEVNLALPNNRIYRLNRDPSHSVLVETDPDFTNQKRWLSSDYMLNALRVEPNQVQKRLGDGFYEQRLVREQINRLTGRQFLGNYSDFDRQYRALMSAGVTFAEQFNLRVGVALTQAQVAKLTSDIVWLESETVTLPNGEVEKVLVPKVYALAQAGDVNGNGTLLSGNMVTHQGGELINNGTIAGRELIRLDSQGVTNRGTISGNAILGNITGDLSNLGGKLAADRAILLNVTGNITHDSSLHTTEVSNQGYQRRETRVGRKGLIHVKGEHGILQIQSGGDFSVSGADIINDGQGQTYLSAKGRLGLKALQAGFDEKMGGGEHYRHEAVNDMVISWVKGKGDVTLRARDIDSQGADIDAKTRLALLTENDIVLGKASGQRTYEEYHKTKSGSAVAKKTQSRFDQVNERYHKGTELTGERVELNAGRDIHGESLLVVSRTGDIDFIAGNNVTINSATNLLSEQHINETKRSGLLNGGELGFTIGSQKTRQESTLEGAIQSSARNTFASESGNIRIQAGNKASVSNVDVLISNEKTAVISGKNGVRVESGKDVINSTDKYEFSQSGLSIALSTPVTDAVQSAQQSVQKAKATQNEKLKGVYAVKAAEDAVIAAQNAQKVADTLSNLGNTLSENTAAAENPAVKVSVSVGTQKQERESRTTSVTHSKSNLNAGNIALISEEGKVELEGVDTQVKDTLLLDGKLGIESKGVADSYRNQTKEKNHSASVGVFVGFNGDSYGIGLEASGSVGKGKENSESETWQNNQLQAGKLVTNSANGKLTLDATNVKASRWEGEVQEAEVISRQDITKYNSEQVQGGVSGAIALGSGVGGSINLAYNSAKLNTAQVENQTSVDIGKGGMNVTVKGNTHLDGAIITSEADQENNRFQTGTLTTSDIQNHSELKTRSVAISGGTSGINPLSALSLLGNKNDSEQSTTKAAIGENINIVLTNDENAERTLNNLNRDTQNANQKVTKHDINQVQETQELIKGIGEISDKAFQIYTHSEREAIEKAKLELGKVETRLKNEGKTKEEIAQHPEYQRLTLDLSDKQQAYDKKFGTGSDIKRGVDALTAALQGLSAKDVGQAAVGLASPYLNEQIKKYTEGDTQANLIAHALLGAVEAIATGNNALAGAAAGAGSEAAAMVVAKQLYNKKPSELTEAEKQNVVFLSQLAGGLASGIIGDNTQSTAVGAEIGKRAGENNYLLVDYSQLKGLTKTDTEQGQKINEKLEKAGIENIDDYAAQYRACGDNSTCQKQVIDAEMEAISRSYDIINELAKSGELSKNDIDFIQSTLVPRVRGAYASKAKNETTRAVYRSGDLETFAKSEHRLPEARFNAQLKLWVDQGLTDEQIRHKLENEPLAIALSTAGPNVGGRQPSGSGMGVPTFANARQTLLQIRALSKQASDFSVEVPSTVSAKDRQVTVTETVGYGKGATNLRVSTGAENVALYPKLKDDLRSQQQTGFEKVIKDLNVKPQGSVLMLPDYRQKLAEAKSSLPPNLQGRGNSAVAQINIDGLDTTILAGNSRINKPTGSFVGQGKTEFTSLKLPNKEGKFIDRKTDSEYKIFSNLADQLGSNTQAKGQVTIFTERAACASCLGVAEQFNKRYPNIKVNIFDNNGNLIKP